MRDPIREIEDRNAWMDFGRQAVLVYRGAKDEGAEDVEAFRMVAAFYEGMFRGAQQQDDREDTA